MCTATWFVTPEGYELFFNRDERRSRVPAEPARERRVAGVRTLAPRDPEGGGTWIAANEHGLALALLNAWHLRATPPAGGFRSRGLLVRDLSSSPDAAALRRRLGAVELVRFPGFTLAVLEPGLPPVAYAWDGKELVEARAEAPLVSSSADLEGALAHRRALFAALAGAGPGAAPALRRAALERFHRSAEPGPGPLAVCMRRDDARTVSASHVAVDATAVRFRYADGPPDEAPFGEPLVLARVGAGAG